MALLSLKDGKYSAIGYWFEHKSYNSKEPFSKYEVTIDELEANTDIDFFHRRAGERLLGDEVCQDG